jgi:hypothetical protein
MFLSVCTGVAKSEVDLRKALRKGTTKFKSIIRGAAIAVVASGALAMASAAGSADSTAVSLPHRSASGVAERWTNSHGSATNDIRPN